MVKRFVLDTNVLLHNPDSLLHFEDNDVIIPIYVIEEIDTFKRNASELGRNARQASRHLDRLRHQGSLMEGDQVILEYREPVGLNNPGQISISQVVQGYRSLLQR